MGVTGKGGATVWKTREGWKGRTEVSMFSTPSQQHPDMGPPLLYQPCSNTTRPGSPIPSLVPTGTRMWATKARQALTWTALRPPKHSLLHSRKSNTPCGLGPSQAPTPQLTGPQLPCCIRLHSSCTQAGSLLHNLGARTGHPHPPGSLPVTQRKPQPYEEGTGSIPDSWHLDLGGGWGGAKAPGWQPGPVNSPTGLLWNPSRSHMGACFLPSTVMIQTTTSLVPVNTQTPTNTSLPRNVSRIGGGN